MLTPWTWNRNGDGDDEPSCPLCGGTMRHTRNGWWCEDKQCDGTAELRPQDAGFYARLEAFRARVRDIDQQIEKLESERDEYAKLIASYTAADMLHKIEVKARQH